jgi:hypothetical protein
MTEPLNTLFDAYVDPDAARQDTEREAATLDVERLAQAALISVGDAYSRDEWGIIAAEYDRLTPKP